MAPSHSPPKRRWLSISLRSLLLGLTVLALGLGWYCNRALRQRAAVASILRQGGRIYHSYNDPLLTAGAESRDMPRLANLLGIDFVDRVTIVEFIGPEFDDDDLALLEACPDIHWLRIYETKVTGATFYHVSRRTRVTHLLVNHSPLENEALAEIGKMTQLTTLHLVGTRITDEGLQSLEKLTKLSSLSLSECDISAAGLATCTPSSLVELSLENTHVGDDALPHLEKLPSLQRLSLYGSRVSDRGVPGLARLPQLSSVMLGSTNVTDDGLRKLIAARGPKLFVSPDPDGTP